MSKNTGAYRERSVKVSYMLNLHVCRPRPNLILAISSNVDDRTAHELYVFPFMEALRENVGSVLCGYQQANNSYSCQNPKLLNGILKTELGFQGFVMRYVSNCWLCWRRNIDLTEATGKDNDRV